MTAQDDLASFKTTVAAGDQYMQGGEYDNAVQSYRAAGQAGVSAVGPAIDAETNGASKSLTHKAWLMNANLNGVAQDPSQPVVSVSGPWTESDAIDAQSITYAMEKLYDQAIALPTQLPPPPAPGGSGGGGGGVVPGGGGAGPLANTGGAGLPRWLKYILAAVAVGGLGLLGWALFFRGKHHVALGAAESGRRRRRSGKHHGKHRSRRGKKRGHKRH